MKIIVAQLTGQVGGKRLAGGAFAQHTVAARAALEVNLVGPRELLLGQARNAWNRSRCRELFFLQHIEAGLVLLARRRLVLLQILGLDFSGPRGRNAQSQRRGGQRTG